MKAPRLADIHGRCFSAAPRPWQQAEIEALLNSRGVHLLCEGTAGFAMVRIAGPEAEILTIAVLPEHRRKGIASRLLAQAHRLCAETGVAEIFLEVSAENPGAEALYLVNGYDRIALRPAYYRDHNGNGVDAVMMRRVLPR